MMGSKVRAFAPEVTVCLESLVPQDDFYRHLERALDLSFVRDLVQDRYAGGGRPSIDPVIFFKLQLILFFEGLRSERQLMRVVADRLSLRWYLGYDFGQAVSDHSSLTRIRDRYGLVVFQRFFERVVELCQQAGLVWGKELFFDATKVQANADYDSLVPRFALKARAQAHLDALFSEQTSAPAAAAPAAGPTLACADDPALPEPPAPPLLPTAATAAACEQLAQEQAQNWKLLDWLRLDPARPPSGPYRRITDFRVSTTDPDATPLQVKGRGTRLGYYDHCVVDGGKARIILATLVTPADVMENMPMLDLLRRVRFRYGVYPQRAVADAAFGTGENLRELAAEGIRAYIPVVDYEQNRAFFPQRAFTYDAEHDVYHCPQGAVLHSRGNNYVTRVRIYQAPTATCAACPVRAQCTESTEGRKLNRHFDEEVREQARQVQETPAYVRAIRKRSVWIEPIFGEAKQWHGLRQFRLRGLAKVNTEALLIAAGQNLKRQLAAAGGN